jgi:DNA modification methylase
MAEVIQPYYQDESVTIYNADCRDVLPMLGKVDLVLTDPPYGIASVWKGGGGHGWGKSKNQGVLRNKWDSATPSNELIMDCIALGKNAIVWGGNYYSLPVSRGWLIWNKPERGFTLAEAELAWTNRDNVMRVYDANRSDIGREHPTQKPISLMKWCIGFFPDAQHILDPFMGSGTTLRAAKDLNRKAIGIEIEERYCEIAAKRMSQLVMELK